MLSSLNLPVKLHGRIDGELQTGTRIRWVEQPIARLFTVGALGASLSGNLWTSQAAQDRVGIPRA